MGDNYENRASPIVKRLEGDKFDTVTPSVITIDEEHWLIHKGMVYLYNANELGIPDGQIRDTILLVGDRPVHLKRVNLSASEGPVLLTLSRSPSLNSPIGGDERTASIVNLNELSTNTSLVRIFAAVTLENVSPNIGTPLLGSLYIPAQGNQGVSGESGAIDEFVLRPNTAYLIRFFNDPLGAGTADVYGSIVWYEIIPEQINDYPQIR